MNQFTLGMADEAKRELQEQYNERLPYRFDAVPHGTRPGSQRLRGPAVKKHVRCLNTPRSMRANFDRPTTNCTPGEECGCGTTVVVHAEEQARERQRIPFGTTEWAASYGRRSAIEHFNAEIKGNRGVRIERGFTRVYGAVKNQVLVTFALVGANVRLLRDWHICRSIADPWMAVIDDTDDPDWSVAHARFKRRQPRVRAFHEAYYASRGRPLQAA
ncbi:transposase [uncultured Cellulomonas sp.]|uniref:transposase n=1 Tax=uncultured Cellulomonas sp. TaxID=189682 RepID=UPI0028E38B63|nr:transposase [uncultured Cellulomonas sp.]